MSTVQDILEIAKKAGDPAFTKKIEDLMGEYSKQPEMTPQNFQ